MTFILDLILALITGIIVILTIIYSIINIQQMNYNTQMLLAMHDYAEDVIDILSSEFLEKVGRHFVGENVFTNATATSMTFRFKENSWDTETTYLMDYQNRLVSIIENPATANTIRFSTINSYPLETPVITYYGSSSNVIINPVANLDSIRGCRVDLIFNVPGWGRGGELTLRYPITFWKYFKNMYIRDIPPA